VIISVGDTQIQQRIFIIEGGWYGGVCYECNQYFPETRKVRLVYGGPGTRKKDIVRWLKRRHSEFNWDLKTTYNGDHWKYIFTKKLVEKKE